MQRHTTSALLVMQCPLVQRRPFLASTGTKDQASRRHCLQTQAVLGAKQDTTKTASLSQSPHTSKTGQGTLQLHPRQVRKAEQASELFAERHVSARDPLFYAYFPFGVAIAGMRMLMWLSLLFVDQAWLTDNDMSIAILQAILGVQVNWRNKERLPRGRYVMVSNHVTTGDMMALYRLPEKTVHLISSQLPDRIAKSKNHRIDFRHASVGSYDQIKEERQRSPIHLFPEGGMTNGAGMMKFNKGFMRFSEGLPVVPVALRAQLPWGILTHTLHSSFLSNMFWFCFSPYVSLEMSVLPPVNRAEGESKAKFVERIQQKIADDLQVPIIDFTLQAKKQLMRSSKPEQ